MTIMTRKYTNKTNVFDNLVAATQELTKAQENFALAKQKFRDYLEKNNLSMIVVQDELDSNNNYLEQQAINQLPKLNLVENTVNQETTTNNNSSTSLSENMEIPSVSMIDSFPEFDQIKTDIIS